MDDKPRAIVYNGLRIHLVQKNAHSAIKTAFDNTPHETGFAEDSGNEKRVMVVRHPFDRMVSGWAFFTQRDKKNIQDYMYKLGYRQGQSWEDWFNIYINEFPKNIHTRKQVTFTCGYAIDYLIPIEELREDWETLQGLYNLPDLHKTNTSSHEHWSQYFTDEQQERAFEVFSDDLELYIKAINRRNNNG